MRTDTMDELKDTVTSASAGTGSSAVSNPGMPAANVPSSGNGNGNSAAGAQTVSSGIQYSIPGILHFLQHEWSRFEMERGQWEVERAELQARIAFLQGERKGQENLKNDLVRRIKMLEYALKQERAKFAKLKYGNESSSALNADSGKPPLDDDGLEMPPLDGENYIAVSNVNWRQGRQLLRQYLQEIGYTDTIIDVRSNRVRSLLGLHDDKDDANNRTNSAMNGGDAVNAPANAAAIRRTAENTNNLTVVGPNRRTVANTITDELMIETESAVLANFDFLSNEGEVEDDDDEDMDGDDGYNPEVKANALANNEVLDQLDKDSEASGDFSFMPGSGSGKESDSVDSIKGLSGGSSGVHFPQSATPGSGKRPAERDPDLGANIDLGELSQLTITNDNESSYDQITAPKESFRKTWGAKYTLRSHFDGVRALGFHPTEPVLITGSEDQTLKLWNLQKPIPAKKSAASLDVEPVYTFRAHAGPVLSLAVAPAGEFCFSGGLDSTIRVWNLPNPNVDPYDSYETNVLVSTLTGHADAVWCLSYSGSRQQLLSASSDGTVKLWSPFSQNKSAPALAKTFEAAAVPTSVDWVRNDPSHMVASYANAECVLYDVETGASVVKFDTVQDYYGAGSITKVLSHPTIPLTITAHEDRHIRFFDNKTGKQTHMMVAHLDAVTSLAVDANGLYLISGSHDSSVRLWNLETKTCVQEITAHRKKFDESIFDVAFHPSRPYIASAGADALAKVFV